MYKNISNIPAGRINAHNEPLKPNAKQPTAGLKKEETQLRMDHNKIDRSATRIQL